MEDWAEIRRLQSAEGMAIKAIVRQLGISRNAVRRALANDSPPSYARLCEGLGGRRGRAPGSGAAASDAHDAGHGDRRADRVEYGLTVLKDRVRELRPYFLPPDPAKQDRLRPGASGVLGKSYAKFLTSTKTETVVVPDLEHNAEDVGRRVREPLSRWRQPRGPETPPRVVRRPRELHLHRSALQHGSDGFVYKDDFEFTAAQLVEKIGLGEDEARSESSLCAASRRTRRG